MHVERVNVLSNIDTNEVKLALPLWQVMHGRLALLGVGAAVALAGCSGTGFGGSSSSPYARPGPVVTVGSVMTGAGALLTAPADPVKRRYSQACDLVDAGWVGPCRVVDGTGGTIAVLTEQKDRPGGPVDERDLVYRQQGDQWVLALSSTRQLQPALGGGSPRAVPADLGDGISRVIFMFTAGDPNFSDAVDVVDASARVVLHVTLDAGKARAATGGGLETWSRATPHPGGLYRHLVIRPAGGVWRVAVDDMVPASSLPVDTAKQRGSF